MNYSKCQYTVRDLSVLSKCYHFLTQQFQYYYD